MAKRQVGASIAKTKTREYADGYDAGYRSGWSLGREAGKNAYMKILQSIALRDTSEYLVRVLKEANDVFKDGI